MLQNCFHSALVSVHRVKAHENLHPVFEANHQRSTSSPQRRHGPLPLGSHSGRTPTTCRAAVQCSVYNARRPRTPLRRDAIPHSGRTPNARELTYATCRHQRIHVHTHYVIPLSSLLATYSAHSTQQTQPSIPLRPLRHVTSNGQDGARSCSISPDSHPAPAVPVSASRTPGPSRQS